MTDAGRQGDMAQDAALAITRGADRYRRLHDGQQWEAIEDAAAVISCYAFGHPSQPRARRKWSQRPWRCFRCETWWVAEHYSDYSNWDMGGEWRWTRVHPDQGVSDD